MKVPLTARSTMCHRAALCLVLLLLSACASDRAPEEGTGEVSTSNADADAATDTTTDTAVDTQDTTAPDSATTDAAPDTTEQDTNTGCQTDADCDDQVDCTRDLCTNGACTNTPDDGLCDGARMGVCDAEAGCQYGATCTPENCFPGPCETAVCEEGRCVRSVRCSVEEVCCADQCVAPGCDDGNPCTLDTCGQDGCEHTPGNDGAPCDDGDFCNGDDACDDGACSVHTNSPCDDALCDPENQRCVECFSDTDCPADETQTTACAFADTCTEQGTRERTTTTYACLDNTCAPSSSASLENCTQNTDGRPCDICNGESCICLDGRCSDSDDDPCRDRGNWECVQEGGGDCIAECGPYTIEIFSSGDGSFVCEAPGQGQITCEDPGLRDCAGCTRLATNQCCFP